MRVRDLVDVLEVIAPTRLAEPWDNVGLLAGDPSAEVARVLLTIDLTREVLDEAIAAGAAAIVAYHPPVFDGLKRLVHGTPVVEAVRSGVAIYSPHTALDVAEGGTNDVLADVLGIAAATRAPLRESGVGRVGPLDAPVDRTELVARVKAALGVPHLLVAGPSTGLVEVAAVCAGAGGALYADALAKGATLYLTGELRHHDALAAAARGMTVVAALHSNSERVALARLEERLRSACASYGLDVVRSRRDADPFTFA